MEFTDYILEAAGVSDVDIMDIEVTQAMAEMAVLEAMMDCYEKQMVLLEYNEDSADEIFNEAEIFVPEMSEFIQEARVEYHDLKMKHGWKIVHDTDAGNKDGKGKNGQGLWYLYGVDENGLELVFGPYDSKQQLIFNARNNKQARAGYGKHNIAENRNRIAELKKKINEGKAQEEAAPASVERAVSGSTAGQQPTQATNGTSTATEPNQSSTSDKKAAQWDGDSEVSGPSKSFGNSFKKFMSKAGSVVQQLVLGLVDAIFEVNFEKLKEKVLDKGADFEVKINKNEFDKLNRLAALIKVTENYYEECSLDKLKNVVWTKAKVGAYVDTVRDLEKALREKFELVNAENENDEGYAMNKDDFALLCDKLGHGEFKKLLRKCQKEVSAANIDYNVENQIPPVVGKELRKFVNYLIKTYRDTSKCFTKVLKFAADVGAKAMKRGENSGVDYGTAKNAKRLEQRQKMLGKVNKIGNFSGKVNDRIAAARAQKEAEAEGWAEEGWSMNLSEDEDFF